jgi:NAD(P)-dependent dehydrogenase (short-subunit alcohol dehydrogenase family)
MFLVDFSSAQGNRPRSRFISTRDIQSNRHCNLTHSFVRAGCSSYRTSRRLANRSMRHASSIRTLASEPLANNLHRTDELAFTRAIQSVPAKYGRLDALVLNAGVLDPMTRITSTDTSLDTWRTHFEVNVYSLVTALKAAAPSLRESPNGGKVIFVSSGAAVGGIAGWGPYNASKAAMNSLNR